MHGEVVQKVNHRSRIRDGDYAKETKNIRVVSYSSGEESREYMCQKLLYQSFVNELKELIAPVELSLDVTRLQTMFCGTCDPRLSALLNQPLGNDSLLERQLRFEPIRSQETGQVTHGTFNIHRFWRAGFEKFPTCEGLARDTAAKLMKKLASFGRNGRSFACEEVSYKAQKSYARGRVRWATCEDLAGSYTYLPQLAHVAPQSVSSKIRLCVIPNRPVYVNTELGFRSYNSFIRKNTLCLPSFLKFSLVSALSVDSVFLDIEDCYGSLVNSANDARHSMVFCLKTEGGFPSYDLYQCPDGILYPLVQTCASFGQQDVGRLSQLGLSRCAGVYRELCVDGRVEPDVLDDVEEVLKLYSYCDDSQVPAQHFRVSKFARLRGRVPQRPSCKCRAPCTSWECETIVITTSDLEDYDKFMASETRAYLCSVSSAFVKVANFCSHRIKHVHATSASLQKILDETGMVQNQFPPASDVRLEVVRPPAHLVQAEVEKGGIASVGVSEGAVGEVQPDAACQLGKVYKGNQVFLKTQKLYVCYYRGLSKRRTPSFDNYEELRGHCEVNKVVISKISISSLVGSYWDPCGRHLAIPKTCAKVAARLHLLNGAKSWMEPANEEVTILFWKSVLAYFVVCKLPQPRSNLLFYPTTRYVLLGQSDAGLDLQATVVTLLSFLEVDGQHLGKSQHLEATCYVNNSHLNQNVPVVELIALFKTLTSVIKARANLESLGISLKASQIVLLCDSKTVVLQVRSRAHLYQKKVGSLIARIQLLFGEQGLCPFEQLFWVNQRALPPAKALPPADSDASEPPQPAKPVVKPARYHADILSKSSKDRATPQSILQDHYDLGQMGWIEEVSPRDWGSWIIRDTGVPKMSDKQLLHDLSVNEDHLQQMKDYLEKPSAVSLMTILSHSEVAQPCSAGIVPKTPCLLTEVDPCSRCPTSKVEMRRGNVDSLSTKVEGDGETSGEDVRGVAVKAQGDGDGKDGHEGATPHQPLEVSISVSWSNQVEHLIQRKMGYGLGPKSAVTILAFVLRFVLCLKRRLAQKRGEKMPNSVPWQLRGQWPRQLQPWCGELYCGLNHRRGCNQPHPRMLAGNSMIEIEDGVIKPEKKRASLEQRDAHFLFRKLSLTGCDLGDPDILAQMEMKLRGKAEELDESCLTIFCLRVVVFDYLCWMFGGDVKVQGYETEQFHSLWGVRLVARGRKQRDWLAKQDTVPRLRCLQDESAFAHLCLTSSHYTSLGESKDLSRLFLISLRVVLQDQVKILQEIRKSCHACNLAEGYVQRNDTKMRKTNMGPSGRLTALGSHPPGLSCSQLDLIGPLKYMTESGLESKIYILICVSQTWGQMRLLPIESKSTKSVMIALKTLALQGAAVYRLTSSDDGGEFFPLSNSFSPMERGSCQREPSVQKWFDSFWKEADQTQLQQLGVWLKLGKAQNCSAAERRVSDVKRIFKRVHLFSPGSQPTNIFEILYLCSVAEFVCHSRPILIHGNTIYSLHSILSLMAKAGDMVSHVDGVDPSHGGQKMKKKVEEICSKLSMLKTQMATLICAHHLDSILDTPHRRERVKHGRDVNDLCVGDIVFDGITFRESGHLTGSLARVCEISASHNHVLVSKCLLRQKYLKTGLFKKNIVSRPASECHFVAHGTEDPIAVGPFETFNLPKYLPKDGVEFPIWHLAPPPLPPGVPDPTAGVMREQRDGDDHGEVNGLVGVPPLPPHPPAPVIRTRRGRAVKQTKFFGV